MEKVEMGKKMKKWLFFYVWEIDRVEIGMGFK